MAAFARGSAIGVPAVHANGTTPVHAPVSYSLSASMAKPVRVFAETSTSGTASTIVAFNSFSLGGRTVSQRPRITYSTNLRMASSFIFGALDYLRPVQHHHGAIVHRMSRSRGRTDNPIQQRNAQAKRRADPGSLHLIFCIQTLYRESPIILN